MEDIALRSPEAYSDFHLAEAHDAWKESLADLSRDRQGAVTLPLADARGSVPEDPGEGKLL